MNNLQNQYKAAKTIKNVSDTANKMKSKAEETLDGGKKRS